jgi:hypothetical protein
METSQWNYFAEVLEAVLKEENSSWRLSSLDDKGVIGERVHPEKVRRLLQSQKVPGKFPVLNPDELEHVIKTFGLEAYHLRLRAAILATSIQKFLHEREMSPESALKAAQIIMPAIFQALQEAEAKQEIEVFRQGNDAPVKQVNTMEEAQEVLVDTILENALMEIDRGTLVLHLLENVQSNAENIERVHEATLAFEAALHQLQIAEERIQRDPSTSN